ncbi:hypothetical protein F183_A33790 [Bryobacterales bacterium F-183]|nr:hypothetical protein F183_A33790 [Bryobacterales bacterium F-183]
MKYSLSLIAFVVAVVLWGQVAPQTEHDYKLMLEKLGIQQIRQGANGRDPNAPNAAIYDEAKVKPIAKLPDPLVLKNGKRVTSANDWWKKRRPEIVEDFDREVYGRMPKNTPKVNWEVTETKEERGYRTQRLVGHVDNSSYPDVTVDILATLAIPIGAREAVPVIVEYGFNFPVRPGATTSTGPTWQEQVMSRRWAYATITPVSIQADNGAGLTAGIIGLVNKGQPRKPDDWGALRAWGWGASRFLDYLETEKLVDAKRVALEGHSRYGKSVLVTMADDPRFAVAFVSSSGAGGAKLHRRTYGELLENVAAANEYHWMAGNYLKYAGPMTVEDLPVDSHELIALVAPRPVFISAGTLEKGDGWVDPKGSFLAAVAAGPVYKLLGKKDLGTTEFPPVETGLMAGDIAFRQHSGGHVTGPNWPVFLEFAARYFYK